MKSLRHELLSLGVVLSLPLVLLGFFPREALFFRAAPLPRHPEAFLSFASVSLDEEARLLASLQTTWKPSLGVNEGVHLSLRDLPEDSQEPLLRPEDVARPTGESDPFAYEPPPWKPSRSASPPQPLDKAADEKDAPPFARDDFLKLY